MSSSAPTLHINQVLLRFSFRTIEVFWYAKNHLWDFDYSLYTKNTPYSKYTTVVVVLVLVVYNNNERKFENVCQSEKDCIYPLSITILINLINWNIHVLWYYFFPTVESYLQNKNKCNDVIEKKTGHTYTM